jgi:hypothetical protein
MKNTHLPKEGPLLPPFGGRSRRMGAKKLILLIALLALVSCRSTKPTSSGVSKSVVSESSKDTVMFTQPDSATLTALLKCDSLGNAYLAEITHLKTGRATSPQIRVKDNFIYLKCRIDSMAVYVSMHRQFKTTSDTTSTVVTVFKERQKGKLETFLDRAIILLVGSILGALILFIWFRK